MSAKTGTALTVETLIERHGAALSYLDRLNEDDRTPAGLSGLTGQGLLNLARGAVDSLQSCHHWREAETIEDAIAPLSSALQVEGKARATLLRKADKALNSAYDIAQELSWEVGENFDD